MKLRDELTNILVKAVDKPGIPQEFCGRFFEEELEEIENRGFIIHLRQPWMNGGGEYTIKYPYRSAYEKD